MGLGVGVGVAMRVAPGIDPAHPDRIISEPKPIAHQFFV